MRIWIRFVAAFIALSMAAIGSTSASAEQYLRPDGSTVSAGETLITIDEPESYESVRKGLTLNEDFGYDESFLCDTFLEEREVCNVATPNMQFSAFHTLPFCETGDQENCIENLTFTEEDSDSSVNATLIRSVEGNTYDPVPDIDLHAGGTASLWRAPGFLNSEGTDTYAVLAFERQNYSSRLGRFETSTVTVSVVPYVETQGNYAPIEAFEAEDVLGKTQVYDSGPGGACAWVETGLCGKRAGFVGNPTVSVTVRYSTDINGWFRGRLTKTDIQVENFSDKNVRVTISGGPVEVPRFAVYANRSNTPAVIEEMFPFGSGGSGQLYEAGSGKGAFANDGYSNRPYVILESYRDAVNDSAFGVSSLWSLESFTLYENQSCFKDSKGLIGVVTTNSTAYEGTEPTFDSGYLSYKVAGLHYAPDGETVNEGTYDLVMRSDVARCLYGFKNAPVSATVAVVGEQGEEKVATTIVSEKDGWLKLAAYGFTFSEKEIQVQLRQSQMKTLKTFSGSRTSLTSAQKAEIRDVLEKSDGNTKFICTGIRYYEQPMSVNIMVRKRAKEACDFAKSINPNFSYWYQTKPTKARSYAGKVFIVSKG
ncbi:MAG: hypothetical protein DCO81_05840 [Candidatus Aquiluna sp. XM-24bin5]|nr:MAG: hypothetical protein DCO81_05840 [Candidatus Aquiluna sp. XM-24bin5]